MCKTRVITQEMPSKKIHTHFENSQSDLQQSNFGYNSATTWQYHDTNTNRSGHLCQSALSNLGNKMSGNLEGYHFINGQIPWDLKEGVPNDLMSVSSDLMTTVEFKSIHMNFNSCSSCEACLVLRIPPENRFRYRYDTEMSGTHGSLQGIRTGREKSVPTVELINYPFEALIRVTLVTCQDNEHYPHPHSLFVKEKLYQKKIYENWDGKSLTKTGHYCDPHYIRVGRLKNDYTAGFEGMCIINSKKENFHSAIREKLQMRSFDFKHGIYKDNLLSSDEGENLVMSVETAVSAVDVDFVSLCFEAFKEEDGKLYPICQPIYSEPIGNAKSAKTGKLKISRINKCSASCKGGDEIWLLVEKINKKGLVVRFSEECNGKVVWEACIEGDDLILHHQYAIIFKTPPYKDINILSEVEVLMRLERTTQPNQPCDYSEPITFVYEPFKSKNNKGDNLYRKESIITPLKQFQTKRPRTEPSLASAFTHQSKRKTDDLELEDMNFEESDDDIERLLFDGKDSFELEKFNVEEFLRFISADDEAMPVQRDGIPQNKSRRDLFYKLYLLYSKLDENDIKKLTDQISNFRVSKKEGLEKKGGLEKDQVKDAASTLLALRSKAMVINNNNNNNNNIDKNDDVIKNSVSDGNKTNCTEQGVQSVQSVQSVQGVQGVQGVPVKKTESINSVLESCCEPFEVQGPVHMSVIKYNLSKISNQTKNGKNFSDAAPANEVINNSNTLTTIRRTNEKEYLNYRVIKKERNLLDCVLSLEKMENVYEILNTNGSWISLAELWNCTNILVNARESSNPARYVLEYLKQGTLELETLRDSLDAINEKEALRIFNEILMETFNT